MTERMRTAACGLATMAVAVALVLVLAPLTAAGQTTDASTTPRTSWDAPDLRGLWDFRTLTPLQRPAQMKGKEFLSDEEAATFEAQILEARNKDRREDLPAFLDIEYAYNDFWWDYGSNITDDRRTALIVDPPNGRIPPLTPAAREKIRAPRQRPITERVILGGSAHGPEDLGLSERCMLGFSSGPPIVPSEYNNILQVFQTPDYVVIFTEMVHEARIVPLDGRPHISGDIRQWLGDSRGHWEGDTLVIETHRGAPAPPPQRRAATTSAIPNAAAIAAVVRGFPDIDSHTAESLGANQVPTLAMVGDQDALARDVRAMGAVMSNLEVLELGGANHLTAQGDPRFLEKLLAFLDEHSAN